MLLSYISCALISFTSTTIWNLVSFALSLNILLLCTLLQAHSHIRNCVYSTYPTSRSSGDLCITLSEPLLAMLTPSEAFVVYCFVVYCFVVYCFVLHFTDTSSALQVYQCIVPASILAELEKMKLQLIFTLAKLYP